MMEIKKYSEPTMEITEFDIYDVITVSNDEGSSSTSSTLEKDDEEGFVEGWV